MLRDVFHGVFSVDNKVIIGALQNMRDTLKLFMLSVGTAWVQAYHSTERLGIYYFKGIAYSLSYLRTIGKFFIHSAQTMTPVVL